MSISVTKAGGVVPAGSISATEVAANVATQAELDAVSLAIDSRYSTFDRNTARAVAATVTGANDYIVQTNGLVSTGAASGSIAFLYIDPDDWSVAGRTTKLRIRAACGVNDTAPAQTVILGLHAVTNITGGVNVANPNISGTPVVGTTITFTTPAANSESAQTYTSDIDLPAEGWYVMAVNSSGAFAANSAVVMPFVVQIRNV